jgi:hypothetical protein
VLDRPLSRIGAKLAVAFLGRCVVAGVREGVDGWLPWLAEDVRGLVAA